ncbi:MAG: tetratricopeptide repeat protein [Myxococcaceae bacterium]|nr:tetratricopeptide repeat protein [Myxococcaceae bacterium]
MRLHRSPWLLALALALPAGCKDPETAARQSKLQALNEKLVEGRALLAAGKYNEAIQAARLAASAVPTDPSPYLLMADAQREAGNTGAAILSLKQAADLSKDASPELKKQLADLYQRSGHPAQAISVLTELKEAGQLADPEVLTLARLQAREGDVDAAFKTLELIQRRQPDNAAAKVLEAEILLLKGEEQLAATLMDRLVASCVQDGVLVQRDTPCEGPPEAWLLRARYFFNSSRADLAEADLAHITGQAAEGREVIQLRARVLNELKRHEEAEAVLRKILQRNPRDTEVLAQLAETILYEGRPAEAQQLVDEALALKPTYPRALYVRARALEAQGELKRAAENYQYALKSDPSFAPALSRIWRIYDHRGEKAEAMSALERLFFMGEASLEEKVALAELYAQSQSNVSRGRKLIEEALRRDPENERYKEIRAKLIKAGANIDRPRGPIIMRGGH